jgi:hypothetical protein
MLTNEELQAIRKRYPFNEDGDIWHLIAHIEEQQQAIVTLRQLFGAIAAQEHTSEGLNKALSRCIHYAKQGLEEIQY